MLSTLSTSSSRHSGKGSFTVYLNKPERPSSCPAYSLCSCRPWTFIDCFIFLRNRLYFDWFVYLKKEKKKRLMSGRKFPYLPPSSRALMNLTRLWASGTFSESELGRNDAEDTVELRAMVRAQLWPFLQNTVWPQPGLEHFLLQNL